MQNIFWVYIIVLQVKMFQKKHKLEVHIDLAIKIQINLMCTVLLQNQKLTRGDDANKKTIPVLAMKPMTNIIAMQIHDAM